jgi:hypothetical protein
VSHEALVNSAGVAPVVGFRNGLESPALLGSAIETAAVHPDYVSFFNIAAGGARNGERYLIDSNLDWGQDLCRLSQWLRTSDLARGRPIALRVFGDHDPPLSQLGIDPALTKVPLEPRRGLLAISKNVKHRLHGAIVEPNGTMVLGEDYSWLAGYPVIAHVGDSIDVYDLDHPLNAGEARTVSDAGAATASK